MSHLNSTVRRRAAVIMALSVAAVGLGLAGPGLRPAVAQEECDEQCWRSLTTSPSRASPREIEALGESGLPPDPLPPPATTTTLQPTTTTAPAVCRPQRRRRRRSEAGVRPDADLGLRRGECRHRRRLPA